MRQSATATAPVRMGLVNLMPDAALRATECQFLRLVQGPALPRVVDVLRATLPGLDRGPEVEDALASRYVSIDRLLGARPHALIVTGTNVATADVSGHPEYDTASLLKEYAREWQRAAAGERDIPPAPTGYLPTQAQAVIAAFRVQALHARQCGGPLSPFPEAAILPLLTNTWRVPARLFFRNWLERVARRV